MSNGRTEGLERGDRAPDFVAPLDGRPTRFYSRAGGRPTVIAFCAGGDAGLLEPLASGLEDVPAFAVVRPEAKDVPKVEGMTVFMDEEDAVTTGYRLSADSGPTAFVLDANLRVTERVSLRDTTDVSEGVRRARPDATARVVTSQAPVLLVPNVLDLELCNRLERVWAEAGGEETGVEASADSARVELLDVQQKRRRDHTVDDSALMKLLTTTVGGRVIPEVHRAFHYQASRFEGFKIACYESESQGFFSPHRDNLSPSTAHRRFAVTLNLNEDYEGGHLRFPEFGPHLYRPPAGGALIFSCSMLHEVLPVTEGRRFALLTFMFGSDALRPRGPSSGGS